VVGGDYDVEDSNGNVVGRIFRSSLAPRDRPWLWTITLRSSQKPNEDRGFARTREDAMAAFKKAWLRK
jgi:hypothetical protein